MREKSSPARVTLTVPARIVALYRLPVPAEGLSAIADVTDRVYGVGGMLAPIQAVSAGAGDVTSEWVAASAPEQGFGARVSAPLPPAVDLSEDMVSLAPGDGGGLVVDLESPSEGVRVLAASMSAWFSELGAVNYVESSLSTPGEDAEWVVTLQKPDGLTPHQLRCAAEARVAELEAEVAELRARVVELTSH